MNQLNYKKIPPLSLDEKINFFMEFYSYIKSSIPMTTCLTKIANSSQSRTVRQTASSILQLLDRKENFSTAILKFENTIGGAYCNLLATGSETGELPKITLDILNTLKKQRTTKRNIIKAGIYPAILLFLVFVFSMILILLIVPKVTTQAELMTDNLPLILKILKFINKCITHGWFIIIIALFILLPQIIKFFKTVWQKEYIIKLPVIGNVVKTYNISLFLKLFAMAYGAGIPAISAYLLASKSVSNNYIKNELLLCSPILEKQSISKTFEASGIFTPQIISNVEAGEMSGNIDEILKEISNDMDEHLDTVLSSALQALEPVLIIIAAIFILIFGYIIMGPANPFNYI